MVFDFDDTIAALSSAAGPACRGIIRLSGPGVAAELLRHLRFPQEDLAQFNQARNAARYHADFSVPSWPPIPAHIDYWPTTRSYTGEPMAEIHTVGAPPLLERILSELFAHEVRPARPGEFTMRSFLNGRIDLIQAEAVLGVIDADDHEELELALGQLAGGISSKIQELREELLILLADLEAGLDFADEDIEFIDRVALNHRLKTSMKFIGSLIDQANNRLQSSDRLRVVLAGLPNAGKSTLFNALADSQKALVSQVQGTTRDYLSVDLSWEGQPIELVDTAGWELASEGISLLAQQQRNEKIRNADLVVWCTATDLDESSLAENDKRLEELKRASHNLLMIQTKSDLHSAGPKLETLSVSAFDQRSLENLRRAIHDQLQTSETTQRQILGSTSARCVDSLVSSQEALRNALSAAEMHLGDELIAIEMRESLDQLGKIVGVVFTDDILDRVFSRFCIGK